MPQGPLSVPQGPLSVPQGPLSVPQGPSSVPQGPIRKICVSCRREANISAAPHPCLSTSGPQGLPQYPLTMPQGRLSAPQGSLSLPQGPPCVPEGLTGRVYHLLGPPPGSYVGRYYLLGPIGRIRTSHGWYPPGSYRERIARPGDHREDPNPSWIV